MMKTRILVVESVVLSSRIPNAKIWDLKFSSLASNISAGRS